VNLDVPPGFAGVVSIRRGEHVEFERAYGAAERAHGIAATPGTQFALASGTKGFTATAVVSLIAEGALTLETTARSVLGAELPLIADDVTVEHLLAHRSGIGDYVEEDAGDDRPLNVPVQNLVTTADYLPALDGFPTKFAADTGFAYCNSGFVVLALIAERVSGRAFHDLVEERVFTPAAMADSAFLRSDELPGRAAVGYLDDGRTNVFHIPLRGNGDGGAYSTVADVCAFWRAFFSGRLVPASWMDEMVRARSQAAENRLRYGLGLWLDETAPVVMLEGCDHGVSFRTWHDPQYETTWTVVSNTTDGAWPIARQLRQQIW
jgi:CubicO group peptidase (beta-lactamase class C family)